MKKKKEKEKNKKRKKNVMTNEMDVGSINIATILMNAAIMILVFRRHL